MPVQKQTRAGQRTRFKAFVAIGDYDGHVGLGVKCAKEVATAIRGAIIQAKLSIIPVRRGYWGNKLGKPHTVPCKVTGKCGSVTVRLIPAPRGTSIVAAGVSKNFCRWQELPIVTLQPMEQLLLLVILQWQLTLLLLKHIRTGRLICGL